MSLKNNYYIFRHAETYNSKNGVDYGDQEYVREILPEGIPAIKRLAEYLKNVQTDSNLTSELLRCVQTSEVVSEVTGKKFEKYPLLNEMLEPTFSEFKTRMEKLVRELESVENKTYLLCTHGACISALKYLLTNKEYDEANLMDFPKTGTLMIIKKGTVDLLDFNSA